MIGNPAAPPGSTTASAAPRRTSVAIALGLAAACAPPIDGPIEHQRAIDRDDADRVAAQLAALPGAVAASVVLHHAMPDPLAPPGAGSPSAAAFSAVITVDDLADPGAIRAAAIRLARAALPELPAQAQLAIEINPAVHRPVLAKVGPFSVEDSSRTALEVTLALGCLTVAALAAQLALRARHHRRGNSAQ